MDGGMIGGDPALGKPQLPSEPAPHGALVPNPMQRRPG
ncbi:hypothetical protein AH4AK4_1408 [Aeromonas hydrophila 4AK4]|nr:hypothetical protein AH4AK4_1408 [Aeromonas hydrophila 4AK4]